MATLSPGFIDIRDSYPLEFNALISARRTSQLAHDHAIREHILDVATELFAVYGYTATPVRRIAAQIGRTSASLYNHFACKEDILYSIVVRTRVALFDHECLQFSVGMHQDDVIAHVLRHAIEFVVDKPSATSVSTLAEPYLASDRRALLEGTRRHRLNWFADTLSLSQCSERSSSVRSPLLLASMLRAYVVSLAQFVLPATDFPEADVAELALNSCLSILGLEGPDDGRGGLSDLRCH